MRHTATIRQDGHIVASHAIIDLGSGTARGDGVIDQSGRIYGAQSALIAAGQTYEITLDDGRTIKALITEGTVGSHAKAVIDFQVTE
jgi:hypothetical protein